MVKQRWMEQHTILVYCRVYYPRAKCVKARWIGPIAQENKIKKKILARRNEWHGDWLCVRGRGSE